MIPEKIKAIREFLGVTELQVSSTINVNSYKYKRSEGNDDYISTEMLILLSIIYKLPFEKIWSVDYSTEDILESDYLNSLSKLEPEQVVECFKDNLCSHFVKKRKKANYGTIKLILKKEMKSLGTNIKEIREDKKLQITDVASMLKINESTYKSFETGSVLPSPMQILCLTDKFNVSIVKLINI